MLRYLDAGNTNPAPKNIESPLVDWEPMDIKFPGKFLSILDRKYNSSPVPTSHLRGAVDSALRD